MQIKFYYLFTLQKQLFKEEIFLFFCVKQILNILDTFCLFYIEIIKLRERGVTPPADICQILLIIVMYLSLSLCRPGPILLQCEMYGGVLDQYACSYTQAQGQCIIPSVYIYTDSISMQLTYLHNHKHSGSVQPDHNISHLRLSKMWQDRPHPIQLTCICTSQCVYL